MTTLEAPAAASVRSLMSVLCAVGAGRFQDRRDAPKPLPQDTCLRRPGVTFQQEGQVLQRMLVMLIEVERLSIPHFRLGLAAASIAHQPEQETHVRRWTVLAQID